MEVRNVSSGIYNFKGVLSMMIAWFHILTRNKKMILQRSVLYLIKCKQGCKSVVKNLQQRLKRFQACIICRFVGILALLLLAGVTHAAAPTPTDIVSSVDNNKQAATVVKLLARASLQLTRTPQPMVRLHTEGTIPHQGIYDQSVSAARDFPLMRDAALAWRLSGDRRYAEQVDAFLRDWTAVYVPSYNPIDETKFDAFIEAYRLTQNALSPETRKAAQAFLRTLAEGYIERSKTHSDGRKSAQSATWVNNWQSHRIKIMALSAAALEDRVLMDEVHKLFLQQIAANVGLDGSVKDFADRDALHYVVYDLEPLTLAALAAQTFGDDWLHDKASNGASLADAIEWLLPYANGTKTHEEFVHTHVVFDKKRADAGVPGFSGQWNPKSAKTLFWQAAQLDFSYRPLAEKLLPTEPDWLVFWGLHD